ncbi:MAG: hypothetical protein WCC30_06505 [Candidatus Dormiibacterota bacterium]
MSESAPDAVVYVVSRTGHIQETTESSPAARAAREHRPYVNAAGWFRLATPTEIEQYQNYMGTKENLRHG